MTCYKANGLSRNEIKHLTRWIRRKTGTEYDPYFPVLPFLENVMPLLVPDFAFEIREHDEMACKHGVTYPERTLICLREDVYLGAAAGKGRDRFTVAHEVGHLLLHECESIALCRIEPGEKLRAFEDPEWQANVFAGELLAPSYLIGGMSVYEVARKCGVSESAAMVQLDKLRK